MEREAGRAAANSRSRPAREKRGGRHLQGCLNSPLGPAACPHPLTLHAVGRLDVPLPELPKPGTLQPSRLLPVPHAHLLHRKQRPRVRQDNGHFFTGSSNLYEADGGLTSGDGTECACVSKEAGSATKGGTRRCCGRTRVLVFVCVVS